MPNCAFRNRRSSGTTLLEVLVTIVIFLVGILAVVQIFPKGFQILLTTNRTSQATAIARSTVEDLTSAPEELPEAIVPIRMTALGYAIDASYQQLGFNAEGNRLSSTGVLSDSALNIPLAPWPRFSGPNVIRRIIGEGKTITAPRQVLPGANNYGCLLMLRFAPLDVDNTNGKMLVLYGNDLIQQVRSPETGEDRSDAYYVENADNSGVTLVLPRGNTDRTYHFSVSAYQQVGSNIHKSDFLDSSIFVSAGTGFFSFPLLGTAPGQIPNLLSIDINALRVQRQYTQLAAATAFSDDPYEYRIINAPLGELLINPLASSMFVSKDGGRQPLLAKANYTVYDWQILREDFRLSPGAYTTSAGNSELSQQYKLALGSILVGGADGNDGLKITTMPQLEVGSGSVFEAADEALANNLVVLDLDTGGVVMERRPNDPVRSTRPLISVNKTSGLVTFRDSDSTASNGTTGIILLPNGNKQTVQLENRALRALYRVKNSLAVQVLKAPSLYSASLSPTLEFAQFFVGRSGAQYGLGNAGRRTRIYFPRTDVGRKVTVGKIDYIANGGSGRERRQAFGQDFIIRTDTDTTGPYVDLTEFDPQAVDFDYDGGDPVGNVKGSSVAVRVSWNPDFFKLGTDPVANMALLDKWGQSYRSSTNETYIDSGEVAR